MSLLLFMFLIHCICSELFEGDTTADERDLSSDVLVKDTSEIIDSQLKEGEKVVIVGHSMGGCILISLRA